MKEIDSLNISNPVVIQSAVSGVQSSDETTSKSLSGITNSDDLAYYVTHKLHNKVQQDGRINRGYNKDGELIANTISPYADEYWRNIEPKIIDLIQALRDKRYLPYSSCEGHGMDFRRYVGLAFNDKLSRDRFKDAVNGLRLAGVRISEFDTISNMSVDISGKRVDVKRRESKSGYDNRVSESDVFNAVFHRNYDNYCFAELIILDEKAHCGPFRILRTLWLHFLKRFLWDRLTLKVTKSINSSEFPKYSM